MVHFAAAHSTTTSSESSTQISYAVKCGMKSLNYGYSISSVKVTLSYKIGSGSYNTVTSWSGGFSSGYGETKTKYFGTGTITINKTHAAQTITIRVQVTNSSGFDDGTATDTYTKTVAAKPSYTVSYNANGGSGTPGSQTKWYGETLTLQAGKPSRTGYTCLGWSTSSTATAATYASSASFTSNANTTLYAVWKANTYSVIYDGNAEDATNVPVAGTRTYNANFTISATIPAKENYNFLGWSTSDVAITPSHLPGQSYSTWNTSLSAVSLYAVWELAYIRPTAKVQIVRNGNDSDVATVTASWKIDTSGGSLVSALVEIRERRDDSEWVIVAEETSGTALVAEIENVSTDSAYDIRLTVVDEVGSSVATDILTSSYFPIDVIRGGKGIAFGAPATKEGFNCAMDATFTGNVTATGNVTVGEVDEESDGFLCAKPAKFMNSLFAMNTLELSEDTYGRMAFKSESTGCFRIPSCLFWCSGGSSNVACSTSSKKVPLVSTAPYNMSPAIFSYNDGGVKVSVGGWYLVTAQLGFTGVTSGDNITLQLVRDSTSVQSMQIRPAGNNSAITLTRLVWADQGQTFYVYGMNQSAARGSMIGSNTYTYLNISAVG